MNYINQTHNTTHDMARNMTYDMSRKHTMFRKIATKLLLSLTLLLAATGAKAADYVFLYYANSTFHIMHHSNGTMSDGNSFDYATCVWSGTSGSAFSNGGRYLYLQNNSVTGSTTSRNSTISGNTIYRQGNGGSYYLRYNNGWTGTNNSGNATACVYAVSSNAKAWVTSTMTISSTNGNSFDAPGNTTLSTSATYRDAYYTLAPNNGTGTTYYAVDGQTPSNTSPSAQNATITWSPNNTSGWTLTSGVYDDGHVRINSSTGYVEYYNEYNDDTNLVVKATASANGLADKMATTTITLEGPKVDPTSISITSASPMTVNAGNTGNITYTLTPSPCYDNVTFESSNTGVVTVNSSGVVTGVAAGQTTITVTAKKIDGTTSSALTKTVTVTVKDKVATPAIAFTPTVADGGATATAEITCSTPGTTIYYTVNGNDPTSSSTPYNGTFTVNDGDIVKAIAIKTTDATYWDNSDVSNKTYTACTTSAPVISYAQSGSNATVTITAETDATIYYTTNGNDPTTSSSNGTTTVTINNVSSGTTIKAFAKSGNCSASTIVSQEIITSGVSGGTVTLYDYEDHNWTYYSGVDSSVDGGNYNTNYAGKLYSPNPRNVKITYKANGGAVSIDESETEFVYYKTLEQGTSAGQYPYTVISNPFSKRPNGKGFGGWKIKEGAEYINGYNDEATLPLDAEIVFVNLPYPSVNCTSAEIELEATWVNYNNRTYANGNTITYSVNGGTYETNFLVLNRNVTGTITVSSPCTIMMVEPDGSTDYRNNYTFTGNITPNNTGVTKIEFARWNSTNTVNANFRNLWIGRGMTTTSQCATLITGINTTNQTAGTKFSIKVESGKYDYFDFYKGHSTYTGGTANTNATITGTSANAIITIGNDYDRAKASTNNENLEFKYGPMFGYQSNFNTRNNRDNKHTLDLTVKSGRIGYTFFMENTNTANYLQGGAGYCMYLSSAGAQTNVGTRNVLIEGGDICTIGSGVDSYNNAPSNNDTPSTTTNYNRLAFNVRIKGGTIHGNVYGGAAKSPSGGNRVMVMTGGQVKGWFAAGCNGTDNDGGQNYGTSWVYIGGNAKVDSEGSTKVLGYANGGNVYAAGAGRQGATTCGEMTFGTNLVIADDSYIERGIYGGGNYGYALASTNIYITGGTNDGKDGTVNNVTTKGGVFGGANQQNGPGINMYMTGGIMKGGVYGGCNTQGTISNSVTMQINGGQVGTSSATANIHGGGYGNQTRVSQNVDITLGTTGQTEPGVTVYGDVYGGSALGYVNGTAATNTYHTYVTLNKGTINGSLYGGGLGDGSTAANVYGPVEVKVYGGSVKKTDSNGANGSGGVYGANNVNGAPQRSVTVDIYGTDPAPSANEYALFAVYGGGNAADYTYGNGYPKVTVHNCDNSIEYVYGGGNAAAVASTDVTIYGGNVIGNVFGGGNGTVTAANVTGNAVTKIYGGNILKVFGGSNSQGTIGGTISVTAESQAESGGTVCQLLVDELYGGGNKANSNVGSISIGCMGDNDMINYVYGGANQADITGNINLLMSGGRIGNLFGGNNTSGNISGSITVTVNWDGTCNNNYVGNVFGGGNLATIGTDGSPKAPTVNILNGTVSGNVYGGGKGNLVDGAQRGVAGKVTGNPAVNIGDNVSGHTAIIEGDVYGGGDAADVAGTPVIVVNDCNTEIGYLYGGGNAADVNGTNITVNGGTIHHDAFGGGHGDKDASNPSKYADVKGNVVFNIYSGTFGRVFAGSNSKGDITGTSALTINKTGSCDMKIGEVYGGGNEAAGNAGTVTIGCTGDWTTTGTNNHTNANTTDNRIGYELEGIGTVYGGANQADIGTAQNRSNITLNINSGMVANVFGGNNTSGTIYGDIQVNINKNAETCGWYVGNVFGGGNLAPYSGTPDVNIINGTVSHNVYGGGNEAGVGGGDVTMSGGEVLGGIYGGCNTSGTVDGNIVVNITGGTVGSSTTKSDGIFGGGFGEATGTTGNVEVNIGTSGQTTAGATIYGDVYGGSALGSVNGTSVDTSKHTYVNLNKGIIYGDAYGGGLGRQASGSVTAVAANVYGNVTVTQNGVALVTTTYSGTNVVKSGRVFGCNNLNGSPKATVLVVVTKTARSDGGDHAKSTHDENGNITTDNYEMNAVYGGGNLAAFDPANPNANGQYTTGGHDNTKKPLQVIIDGCNEASIAYVYGGGNAAPTPSTDVLILGSYEIGYSFGGGNGKDQFTLDGGTTWNTNPGADVGVKNSTNYGTGIATTLIYGGTIHEAYGGSNQKGTIVGTANIDAEDGGSCPLDLGKMVGAGKNADIDGDVIMTLGCKPATKIPLLFAGADNANVDGDIELTITSGNFGQVFGGNNLGGIIKGHLKVNIEETGSCSTPIKIDELYLGGNQAAYSRYGYYDSGTTDSYGRTVYSPISADDNTHTAVSGNHEAPYAQPVLNVISCTYIGKVFGGGLGTGAAMYADPTVNINMIPGAFANDATSGVPAVMTAEHINPTDNPSNLGVLVDVYGGGNEAAVYGNTTVNVGTTIGQSVTLTSTGATANVVGAFVSGTVYGAGKGVATDPDAAIVKGNTRVNMAGGKVCRSIYGGGELSSVGTFTETFSSAVLHPYHAVGEPKTCADNTGLTEVIVTGGQVGLVNQLMPDPANPTSDDDYGYIFCAGKGMADSTVVVSGNLIKAHLLAVSGSSHLEISGGLVAASVYGGSENGQVLGDTHVEIKGGQIGTGHYLEGTTHHWDVELSNDNNTYVTKYTDDKWTAAINKIKNGTFTDADAADFHECDAWPFGTEGNRHVYDYYANEPGYDAKGGATPGSDGHSYYGHVFGGGSGYYPFAPGKWRRTAGRVNGNTLVEITGGHILTNVYGGNEITDVLGHCKVEMTGGTVGVPRSVAGIQARPVNSYIFGAGMGDPRVLFNGWSNVGSSEVIVHGDAVVFGSVFGGGEDGHVLGNSSTTIKGNALIGTFGTSSVDGNIFGSGRGFSAIALTAGVICGNVTVNISQNAKILGSVFGGGRLAAVGTHLAAEGTANYGVLIPDGKEQVLGGDDVDASGKTHGHVTINITGGTIGTLAGVNSNTQYSVGDVFGGSKGTLMDDWAKSQMLGLVKNTTVNISQAEGYTTTIYGNVYGGGELASVGSYNYATPAEASTYSTNHPSEPMTEGDVCSLLESGTGLATILITGGTIGQNTTTDTHGNVFGGCLGKAGTTFSGYSFVNNSDVTLQGGTVYGSIFGGGENGHVFTDTDVKIKSGSVGIALDKTSLPDANLNDNMIYRGNVYGGGRGIDKTTDDTYSITAGKVNGNTNVTVEGGTIYRNVYGGGSLASVGILDVEDDTNGNATVTIKGGQIGTDGGASANNYNTLIPDRESRRENGFVFGSGRGMAAGNTNPELARLAYTKNTVVSIEGSANVTGSVFGGGENGHVKYDTKVYVKENSLVGTELIDAEHTIDDNGRGRLLYRGNVYGGGRGIDTGDAGYSLTAGRVYGDTFVEVSGGKIYHDVFGGGSLASVGNETVNPTTGEVTYEDTSGETEVHIKGGIIGYSSTASKQGFNCGFVYGGCRGLSAPSGSDIVKMAYVHDTKVYIEPGADVKGSVFGGGANGHVKNDTYVEISGGSIGTALLSDEVGFDEHGVAAKPVFRGNVYAGGRGVDQYYTSGSSSTEAKYSLSAGAVYGNAELLMTGGHVWHNIYGSGAMASVGTVQAKAAGQHVHDEVVDGSGNLVNNVIYNPDESDINYLTGVFMTGTGKVTVTITGGTVGDTTPGHEGRNNGCVYGAGRGVSADRSDYVASMEYVNETDVTIGTSGQSPSSYTGSTPDALNYPYIYGAVFGGGENGHVKTDTDVKIYSGIIGFPLVEGSSQEYKTAADGSSKNPYRGNVFGAGRGVDPVHHSTSEQRSSSAGRVYGHTNVTMTGGVVRRAIYGGGLLASVGVYRLNKDDDMHITGMIEDEEDAGDATVTISGGYIGNVNPDGTALTGTNASGMAYLVPGDNNGHVFGSSCGMVADNYIDPVSGLPVDVQYRQMGYSHSTHVSISGNDTRVFGSVFGSGENGHVWEDTRIDISGGEIGYQTNSSTFIYAGNVYGSGRGVDHPHSPTGISETAGKVRGNTTVNLTGGIVWRDVYGGGSLASVGEADEAANDSKKNITTNPTTNNPFPYSTGLTRVVIDGTSAVHGSVYGSGRGVASTNEVYKQAAYIKNTLVTVKGSAHVFQNVFGGGNAGHVRKNTDVTIDGSAKIDGNVYGGGAGDISSPTAGLVNHDVAVNVKGGLIEGDVYGGGAIANTNVHDVRNTAVTSCTDTNRGNAKTEVNLTGGIILGDAYGGGQGVIPASTASDAEKSNAAALVMGDVTVTLDGTAFYLSTTPDNQTNAVPASGRVFGCNNINGTPKGTVLVKVLQTKGLTDNGDGTYTVNTSKPNKETNTYELEAVYGGGNLAEYDPWDTNANGQYTQNPEGNTHRPLQVLIDGCDGASIRYVYGGGNAACTPSTDVIMMGCYEVDYLFGGGNGKDRIYKNGAWDENPGANVGYHSDGTTTYGTGEALAEVMGGTIHNVFGGSNTKGDIRNASVAYLDEASTCPLVINEVYGGGNEAEMYGGSQIKLGCITSLKTLYAGAKSADVGGDVELTITSGRFERVFGGNNIDGTIHGSITVNIEETGCHPIVIGELYGCGNKAPYQTPVNSTKQPTINVKSFTSIGRIFGGGLGTRAVVKGNPTVNVNEVLGLHNDPTATISNFTADDYFDANGNFKGWTIQFKDDQDHPDLVTSTVTVPTHEKGKIGAIGTVFGGGNAAKVEGNTNVNIGTLTKINYVSGTDQSDKNVIGVDIRGNVFGGGNQAEVTGNTNVTIGKEKN